MGPHPRSNTTAGAGGRCSRTNGHASASQRSSSSTNSDCSHVRRHDCNRAARRLPTADSTPRYITNGSDGNRWFTESSEFLPATIGRITPTGAVTEFPAECNFCILNDITQGPNDVLYFTSNDPFLGRITTSGTILDPIPMPASDALAGNIAIHGGQVWITDFNGDNLWRYGIATGQFTQFPVPEPSDVAVDAAGIVWFTAPLAPGIGRLEPQTGVSSVTPTQGFPREITIATDGSVWFTERFTPQAVGRLNPATNAVTEFPVTNVGPEGDVGEQDRRVPTPLANRNNYRRPTAAWRLAPRSERY